MGEADSHHGYSGRGSSSGNNGGGEGNRDAEQLSSGWDWLSLPQATTTKEGEDTSEPATSTEKVKKGELLNIFPVIWNAFLSKLLVFVLPPFVLQIQRKQAVLPQLGTTESQILRREFIRMQLRRVPLLLPQSWRGRNTF